MTVFNSAAAAAAATAAVVIVVGVGGDGGVSLSFHIIAHVNMTELET